MALLRFFLAHSSAFWSIAFVVSILFGVQGALIQRHNIEEEKTQSKRVWKRWEPWVIQYPEYFFHNLVCSLAGFSSLFIFSDMLVNLPNLGNISGGTATILVFLSLISILGISGKLSYVLFHFRFSVSGK